MKSLILKKTNAPARTSSLLAPIMLLTGHEVRRGLFLVVADVIPGRGLFFEI